MNIIPHITENIVLFNYKYNSVNAVCGICR